MRNCGGIRLYPRQDPAKHAKQGLSLSLSFRIGCANDVRYQLRRCSDPWIPQDELDYGTHWCFARCHVGDFLDTATAQLKDFLTYQLGAVNNLAAD